MSAPEACPGCARVAAALDGSAPDLAAVLPASVLLLGDHQAHPGYAVLWSRTHVREWHGLPDDAYRAFGEDLRRAAAAVERATGCSKLNLVSVGTQVPHLHVHLFPRYAADADYLRHPFAREADFGRRGDPADRDRALARLKEAL